MIFYLWHRFNFSIGIGWFYITYIKSVYVAEALIGNKSLLRICDNSSWRVYIVLYFPSSYIKYFFRSFVPPVRDDESETQRKAHAKRVRETRRSTQGVTLEELKSAEQIVKQKNQDISKTKLNNSTQVETNNNSTNNLTTPQVSIICILKFMSLPMFSLWSLYIWISSKEINIISVYSSWHSRLTFYKNK